MSSLGNAENHLHLPELDLEGLVGYDRCLRRQPESHTCSAIGTWDHWPVEHPSELGLRWAERGQSEKKVRVKKKETGKAGQDSWM